MHTLAERMRGLGTAGAHGPAAVLAYVDHPGLSGAQRAVLEGAWPCAVIDRFGMILRMFQARATTAEAQLAVELAQMPYRRGLLATAAREEKRGAGGGGEAPLERRRARLERRERTLKRRLRELEAQRTLLRQKRRADRMPTVALVGYTNAGKSALLVALAEEMLEVDTGPAVHDAQPLSADRLFHTLDSTARIAKLPSGRATPPPSSRCPPNARRRVHWLAGRALLVDTVGFLSDLPHSLVACFRSTLAEVAEADVLVHVRDAAHPEVRAGPAPAAGLRC